MWSDYAEALSRQYNKMFEQLGLDISQHYQVLAENFITWHRDADLNNIHQVIKNTGQKCLLAFDANPIENQQYLLELAKEFSNQVKILHYDIKSFFEPCGFVYFPHFFLQQKQMCDNQQMSPKRWRFSFLSSNMRFHRLWFYQQVKSYISEQDCFAVNAGPWRDSDHNRMVSHSKFFLGQEVDLMSDLPFHHAHAKDDFGSPGIDSFKVDWTNAHPAYASMFNILGESVCDDEQVFYTEKTWKAIRSRCLHINLGCQKANYYFRKLGFATDHDVDLSLIDKVKWIKDNMQKWSWEQSQDIYYRHVDVIEHNYHRFYSKDLKDLFANYVKEKLQL
jgi:hypothetical protein